MKLTLKTLLALAILTTGSARAYAAYGGQGTTQGSAAGGPGDLMFCSVVTSAPTYTNAQNYACTMTAAGALRIDGSAVTQPVSATDGAIATIGSKADAASAATGGSLISVERQLHADLLGPNYAAATSAAPSYTSGTTAAMSLDLAGDLRVIEANNSSTTSAAGTAPTKAQGVQSAQGTPLATAASQLRAVTYNDGYKASLAASAQSAINNHVVPSPTIFSKFNATFLSSQTGTWVIQASNDGGSTFDTLATGTLAANAVTVQSYPITYGVYRANINNGGTAATVTVATSFTAN